MSTSSLLRTACGLLLLSAISSFSGCDKLGDPQPRAGKCDKTTTTPTDTTSTSTSGAS